MMLPLLVFSSLAIEISVYHDKTNDQYYHREGWDELACARGRFADRYNKTGWDRLYLESGVSCDDFEQMHALGYAEGILTHDLFWDHKENIYTELNVKHFDQTGSVLPDKVYSYARDSFEWVEQMLSTVPTNRPFWWAAKCIFEQFKGIHAGYNSIAPANRKISLQDLWLYQSKNAIIDMYRSFRPGMNDYDKILQRFGTAFVYTPDDLSDVLFGHSTWAPYGEMRRIAKRVRLALHNDFKVVEKTSYSSYPMTLGSGDDFMLTDNGMVLMSAPLYVFDEKAYASTTTQGLPHWMRALMATMLSTDGQEWADYYADQSINEISIQWLVIDLKQFEYKSKIDPNFVTLIEDVPGHMISHDVTNDIVNNKMYCLYDVPRDDIVYEHLEYARHELTHPELVHKYNNIRNKLLKEHLPGTNSIGDARDLIRYNMYEEDPLQQNRPDFAIAPREDLVADASKRIARGGIDGKVTSLIRVIHLEWEGQCGPTHHEQDPFSFDAFATWNNLPHAGLKDLYNYNWIRHYFDE